MNPKIQENQERTQPSFFAVIPAVVRYDKNLPQGAKLLYGEISALCNQEGYCWAKNAYFAELYDINERTIIRWINSLKESGHITVTYKYNQNKIEERYIRITCADVVKKTIADDIIENKEIPENAQNIENIDNIIDQQFLRVTKMSPPPDKNVTTPLTKMSYPPDKNVVDNNTYNNTSNNTSTTSSPLSDDPLPTVANITTTEAEEVVFTPKELKQKILALNDQLFLDPEFYSRAAHFMNVYKLDYDYLNFIHKQCEFQEPKSFKGYFYTIFFYENMAEEYIARRKAALKKTKKEFDFNYLCCPACGNFHSKNDSECPFCKLPDTYTSSELDLYKQLYELPPDIRDEYLNKKLELYQYFSENKIFNVDIQEKEINKLKKEFGINISA